MNTIKSVYYGWASLIAAGGFAYFLAKRSINADRAQKVLDDIEWRKQQLKLRENESHYRSYILSKNGPGATGGGDDSAGSINPAGEASEDPAPTRHAAVTDGQKTLEKSKYEATEVWRSPKGDRLR